MRDPLQHEEFTGRLTAAMTGASGIYTLLNAKVDPLITLLGILQVISCVLLWNLQTRYMKNIEDRDLFAGVRTKMLLMLTTGFAGVLALLAFGILATM